MRRAAAFGFALLTLVVIAPVSRGQTPAPALRTPEILEAHWSVAWSDEFNGPANAPPDPTKWTYDIGNSGWGNSELENYTNSTQNSYQDGNGNLVIQALQAAGGYTSARLKTQGLFNASHGLIEARIKLPYGQGIWPAFWMLGANIDSVGWPQCGEMDIMENIGREPSINHGSMHGPGYSGGNSITATYTLPDGAKFSDDFHIFDIVWDTDSVEFYVDGNLYQTVTPASLPGGASWVFNSPFFMLLNVAVGGSWPGYPDSTTVFPQRMLVDYVRVYYPSTAQIIPWFADGGGVTTTLVVVNKDTTPEPVTLNFYDPDGNPYALAFAGHGAAPTYSATIPADGVLYLDTDGTSACQNTALQPPACQNTGWVELQSSNLVNGFSVYHLTPNSVFGASDAAVQASPLATTLFLPFDRRVLTDASSNITHQYDTSFALVNPDPSQTAAVTLTFQDSAGNALGLDTRTIAPRADLPYIVSRDFSAADGLRGTITLTSTLPVTGVGERFDFKPYLISTSFPFIALNPVSPSGTSSQVIPWFVDGGGMTSTFIFANNGAQSADYTANFFDTSGNPYTLAFPTPFFLETVSTLSGTQPAGSIGFLDTYGLSPCQDSSLQEPNCQNTGWAQLQSAGNMQGYIIFHLIPNATWGASDVVVQSGPPATSLYLPYDRRVLTDSSQNIIHQYDTSFALLNTDPSNTANVSLSISDDAGNLLGTSQDSIPPNHTKGYIFKDLFPFADLTRGLLTITSSTPLSGIGQRFDYKPYLIFTTFPLLQ